MSRPRALLSLAALYAITFQLTTSLHELAHALTGVAVGRRPVLHHSWVAYVPPDASPTQRLATASAGPLFSLAQGLLFALASRRLRIASPTASLFVMGMAFHGCVNFVGYLFSTPFAPDADLGAIASILGLPMPIRVVLAALGFVGLRWTGGIPLRPLLAHAPADVDTRDPAARQRFLLGAAVAPWPLGVLLVLPMALPVPHWLSLVYVLVAGASTTWVTEFSRKLAAPPEREGPWLARAPVALLAAWLALVVVQRVVLVPGVSLTP